MYRVFADLNSSFKSYEIASYETEREALEAVDRLTDKLLDGESLFPDEEFSMLEDIACLGVEKCSYPFTELAYIGVFQGCVAMRMGERPNKANVRDLLVSKYGLTKTILAESYANLSNYYIDGKLVSVAKGRNELRRHFMQGSRFYEDLIDACMGEFEGVIKYAFPVIRYPRQGNVNITVQTPSDPRILMRDLESYIPDDKL